MAFGLYKAGQGYWVRVLTAATAGVLVLAASAWAWGQMALFSDAIPVPTWRIVVNPVTGGAPAVGQRVTLLGDLDTAKPGLEKIGAADVLAMEPRSAGVALRIGKVALEPERSSFAGATRIDAVTEGAVAGTVIDARGEPVFQPLYLQAAGALLVMLPGAFVIYWLVGSRPGTAEFLIATDGEMKKVNWSTRKGVIDSTWVVILWSVLLAGGLFIVDIAFSKVFTLIGVLQQQ
ncbi:MAG: preprotein translocase subunit SecE [Phycisphaerales bacterium]